MKITSSPCTGIRLAGAIVLGLVASMLSACGGGSGSGTTTTGSGGGGGGTTASVTVSCSPGRIVPDTTSQCAATVTGATISSVTWTASGGTITSAGLFTAPATVGSVTITATAQGVSASGTASISVQLKLPSSAHVVIVMEENQAYGTVIGNTTDWPNLNKLAAGGALATNYYGDVHPSIGNYFMLTTGQLLTTTDSSTAVFNADNIARRMLASNVSFKVYAEGITQGYLGGNTGLYVIRHNPFAMLSDVAGSATVADTVIQPFSQFQVDLTNNALPDFSFIVPDIEDDAHNGTPAQADDWLQADVVTPLGKTAAFQGGGDGVLIVDFDESVDSDTAHGGGHVAAVFWGPAAQAGYTQKSTNVYQHESMLATVMGLLGLDSPPGNAASAQTMAEFFKQ